MKDLTKLVNDKIAEINADTSPAKEYPVELPLGKYCDHTVLRAYTPKRIVRQFCQEAREHGAASVCVNPVNIALVHEELKGTGIHTACVVGFPLGANRSEVKALETRLAIEDGADEIDMVLNIGALRDKDYDTVCRDIKAVVDAADGKTVKVIIETCYLSREEKIAACVLAEEAGAGFVKTSTGMGTGGATVEDVQLMKRVVGDKMCVKASTGIMNRDDVIAMVKAGAVRMGTSRLVQIDTGDNDAYCASKDNQPPKYE